MTHDMAVGRAGRSSSLPVLALARRGEATLRFAFAPGLVLSVTAEAPTLAHFEAEYAPALDEAPVADARPAPSVEVAIRTGLLRAGVPAPLPAATSVAVGSALTDGQRTTRWAVRLGDPEERPLRATVAVSGILGRSFVQGFIVEPLLSMAAARAGRMLLPGAALLLGDELVIVLGRSHSGKTTLAARAIAAGHAVLGDDQVIVGPEGCLAFPRRLRLYPDLAETAPEAFRRLPASMRLAIRLRGLAAVSGMRLPVLARAAAVPSIPEPAETGPVAARSPGSGESRAGVRGRAAASGGLPIGRVVLVERPGPASGPLTVERSSLAAERLLEEALALAADQRARLRSGADQAWARELDRTLELERRILAASLGGVPAERIVLPASLPASSAIDALAAAIGLA